MELEEFGINVRNFGDGTLGISINETDNGNRY